MTGLRVERVADQVIAADVALAGSLDRKGKRTEETLRDIVPEIAIDQEIATGGGPSWPVIVGLVALAFAVLLGGGYALGFYGGVTATATPPPIAASATPSPGGLASSMPSPLASPSPSPSPSPTPVELFFPLNTAFDGCIVIDPQGNITFLIAALTVFNVQLGDYRGAFLVAPGGGLKGTGTATNGANPIVVPMRATAFGVYDKLVVVAPDGGEVDIGPIKQQLPLDLNAETDVRNGCDPSKLQAPTQQNLAGRAYLQAVVPVNTAAGEFAAATANWTSATTPAQAQADAAPLLSAFQAVQPQLLVIAAAYPPAAQDLMAANAAVLKLNADLSDLGRLDTIGVAAWLENYQADLARLSAASNLVREDLGVKAIVTP